MSYHWEPSDANKRNHGGRKIGYVPRGRNYSPRGNTIKLYTRVALNKNGKWGPDPAVRAGTTFVRPANGGNFVRAQNLRGRKNFIELANMYGYLPVVTGNLKWSNVNRLRRKRNNGVQYDPGLGYKQNNLPIN
jgi:hypothetical protein